MPGTLARLADDLEGLLRLRCAAGWDDEHVPQLRHLLGLLAARATRPDVEDLDDAALVGARAGLDAVEVRLLVAAAAPDVDPLVGSVLGLLQGHPGRRRLEQGTAAELLGLGPASSRRLLSPDAPLRALRLLEVPDELPFPDRPLVVPDPVTAALLGVAVADPRVTQTEVPAVAVPGAAAEAVAAALADSDLVAVVGTRASTCGTSSAVAALLHREWLPKVVDLRRVPASSVLEVTAAALRDALVRGTALVVLGADSEGREPAGVIRLLGRTRVPVVVLLRGTWDADWLPWLPPCVRAQVLDEADRAALWRGLLAGHDAGVDVERLAGLRLAPEQQALAASSVAAGCGTREVVEAAGRATQRAGLSRVVRSRTVCTLDDVVLAEGTRAPLVQLARWVRDREELLRGTRLSGRRDAGTGVSALFCGSPGTGKTLAAHALAGELGLDVLTVELSAVVDKYIGETQKRLELVFEEAEQVPCLLLFDEADALFGSRSEVRNARDRYANQEVAYLLQRIERFDGLVVLTTNLRSGLDPAFQRRLSSIVAFPDPDETVRERIWAVHLDEAGAADAVDPPDPWRLASVDGLAGGDIRNIVLAAAHEAHGEGMPLAQRHVLDALVREHRKNGGLLDSLVLPRGPAAGTRQRVPATTN